MERVINIQPYADGIEASCKWNNRRIYVFYNHKVNSFIVRIKSYWKGDKSFWTTSSKRGIHELDISLTLETFSILNECQSTILEYMRCNIKDK